MTIKEINNYYQSLRGAKTETYLYNSDRAHNSAIMRYMLESSFDINMYCGEMSVFRNKFYKHISDTYNSELSDYLKNNLINAFNTFRQRQNSKIRIIFENFDSSYLDEFISSAIYQEIITGKIELYKLNKNLDIKEDLYHFSYSNHPAIVRIEDDKFAHTAICIKNNNGYAETARDNFRILLKVAEKISIS